MAMALRCGQNADLRKNVRPIVLVLIGTTAFSPSRARVVEIGCEELLTKPVTRCSLRLVLDRINIIPTNPAALLQNSSPPRLDKINVLYAEDSLPNQKIMKRMLEKVGATCTVVGDGKLAVEAALMRPTMFDLILMDCNMPVQDGWEATREIQRVLEHKVPIVAVTANALKGDREKCLESGMDDYITKPIKLSILLDVAVKWLNLTRTKRDAKEVIRAAAESAGSRGYIGREVQNLKGSSFSVHDSVETTRSLALPYQLLKVGGDWQFMIAMLEQFCADSQEQLDSCRHAAHVCDTAGLSFAAHLIKGGAASCYATQLANSCEFLERMARGVDSSAETTTNTSSASIAAELPVYWKRMVDDVADCLNTLSHHVTALASMHTLSSFNTLTDVHGDHTYDGIVDSLSSLLEAAVNAYIAAHTVIYQVEKCDGGEQVPIFRGATGEKLRLACTAAHALSLEDLARTTELLFDHLSCSPPPGGTLPSVDANAHRVRSENLLDDMRVTVESLAADLGAILGERMPALIIPSVEDDPQASRSVDIEPCIAPSGIHISELRVWVDEPICDYSALMQNTGNDHKFITALLRNLKDSLTIFRDGIVDQKRSLFDAHSLHGAAVSMCVPRVATAIFNYIVATESINSEHAVEASVRDFHAAVSEFASFLQALENGEPHSRAMLRRSAPSII